MDFRLSLGSAVQLGLREARMDAAPTTLYAMVAAGADARCAGACRFCAQARDSDADPRFLSRVVWPGFDVADVLPRLRPLDGVGRICVQTLKTPGLVADLVPLVRALRAASDVPISICMNPVAREQLVALREAGVERVGVGLDCATPALFAALKPGFRWAAYRRFVAETADVFGHGSVHLIAGLGERDQELVQRFQEFADLGCGVALFAFTPVRGARLALSPPSPGRYRALQVARHLIVHGLARCAQMDFDDEGRLVAFGVAPEALDRAVRAGAPFRTSGCPRCNRPLYNERPGGTMYNYPQPLTPAERDGALRQLGAYMRWDVPALHRVGVSTHRE